MTFVDSRKCRQCKSQKFVKTKRLRSLHFLCQKEDALQNPGHALTALESFWRSSNSETTPATTGSTSETFCLGLSIFTDRTTFFVICSCFNEFILYMQLITRLSLVANPWGHHKLRALINGTTIVGWL